MTTTAVRTWPTLDEVDEAVKVLSDGDSLNDELSVRCYGLIDRNDPLEPLNGVPAPTIADVGALATLCQRMRDEISNLEHFLERFEQLRESAVYRRAS